MVSRNGRWLLVGMAALMVASLGCKKPREFVLTKEQREQIQAHILTEVPKLDFTINADLDGHIRLLGARLSAKEVKAGGTFDITYYWESVKPLKGPWMVFVHMENPTPPDQTRRTFDHHPMGRLYPIRDWKPGEIIEDVQTIRLDAGFPDGMATIWVGVYNEQTWREQGKNDRLSVVNADEVPNDGQGRIRAAQIKVIGAKKGATKGSGRTYTVHKATGPITIDGKMDEEAWKVSRMTRSFVRPDATPLESRVQTRARLLWDDEYLYVAFAVRDDDIWNETKERDGKLWEQDVVEVYLDPGADGKDYVELQVSPANVIFDAWFDSHRKPDWPEAAKRLTLDLKTAVTAEGSVNARDDGESDRTWTVEMAIPFKGLPGVEGPPKVGETWTLNLYRLDGKSAKQPASQGAWSPAGGDFHNLAGAGKLIFREVAGATPALRPPGFEGTMGLPSKARLSPTKIDAPRLVHPKATAPKADDDETPLKAGGGDEPAAKPKGEK